MEGIIDDEPVTNPTAAGQGGQPGPFADVLTQFQYNRTSGGGGTAGAAAGYGAYGAAAAPAQQQPVMDWGQGFNAAQQAALANITGYGGNMDAGGGAGGAGAGDMDADGGYAKRARMEDSAMLTAGGGAGGGAPHTSSSTNQLQALASQGAGWQAQGAASNQLVEGNDLTQVYEAARAQQALQQQQQAAMYGGYGTGLADGSYADATGSALNPSDLQQQMLMQQQQTMQPTAPGHYNLNQGGGRTRLDRIGAAGFSSRVPVATAQAQGPSRLTTGHKHAEYLQNLVRARFNSSVPGGAAGAGAAGGGMVTRSAYNSYSTVPSGGMGGHGDFYSHFGSTGRHQANDGEEADQVLSKCEAVSSNVTA